MDKYEEARIDIPLPKPTKAADVHESQVIGGTDSRVFSSSPANIVQVTGQVNSKDVSHVELVAYGNGGEKTVIDHNGRQYHPGGIVTEPHNTPQLMFGGVTNREALAMVTPEELAAELLKRVWPNWDPNNEHSQNTPKRFVNSLKELCEPVDPWEFTTFRTYSDEMVTLGPIPFYTLCAHHVVPFYGHVWIGYVPDTQIAGLSKFARAVEHCARGMWVQEELTTKIHKYIDEHVYPKGLAVVMKAEHLCMAMRGVQAPGVITTTAKMTGVYADHDRTAKAEFMEWIREAGK